MVSDLQHRDRENWYKAFDADYNRAEAAQTKSLIAEFEDQHGMEISQDAEEILVTFLEMVRDDAPAVYRDLLGVHEDRGYQDPWGHRVPPYLHPGERE